MLKPIRQPKTSSNDAKIKLQISESQVLSSETDLPCQFSSQPFGLLIPCRVEPADISYRKAAAQLLGGMRPLFPNIRTVIADAGLQSAEVAHHLLCQDGWKQTDGEETTDAVDRPRRSSLIASTDPRFE